MRVRLITHPDDLGPFHGGVFVPTMGALHAGHARLVRHAAAMPGRAGAAVVVSIFVNPTQFNDPGDLARYPRTLEADLELCREAGAEAVFAPGVEAVYPPGVAMVQGKLPAVATEPGLEDAHRPGHFAGVCQVVRRLFELVRPRAAVFGEKDWQQLQVIRAMTAQERLGVEIVPVPTVREADGLAMSSRNVFLTPDARARASAISRALCEANAATSGAGAEARMRQMLIAAGLEVEYAVVRDAQTLMPLPVNARHGRALIAARVRAGAGTVRLIDNAEWRTSPES